MMLRYKKKEQEKVWDEIASEWKRIRTRPFKDLEPFLRELSEITKGKVLDAAAGNCRNLKYFCNNKFELYAFDFSKEMLRSCKEVIAREGCKVRVKKSSMTKLPYKDNFFDCIIFIASLHCVPKEKHLKILQELKRVSKKDAYILISVWNKLQRRFLFRKKELFIPWKKEGKELLRYYYLYWPWEFYSLLKKSGLKVVKFKWLGKNLIALTKVVK